MKIENNIMYTQNEEDTTKNHEENEIKDGEADEENASETHLSGHKRKNEFCDEQKHKKRKLITFISCDWQGTYAEFKQQHQLQCQYKMKECVYCGEFGIYSALPQNNMDEHHKKCPYFPIECHDCHDTIQRRDLELHLTEICIKGIIKCDDCEENFEREQKEDHEEICPNKIIPCRWFNYGCIQTFERHRQNNHEKGYACLHLNMVKKKVDKLEIRLDKLQAENVYLIDHIRELQRCISVNNASMSTTISE